MNRRHFLKTAMLSAGAVSMPGCTTSQRCKAETKNDAQYNNLPLWYGFNLQEKFVHEPDEWLSIAPEWGFSNDPFRESDFAWMAELGFNFARLPMSYRCWTEQGNWYKLKEKPLKEIDQAVEYGKQYGLHVNINFHRAPGYCINESVLKEPYSLWDDERASEACAFHWNYFAKRYKGIPNSRLSFDLLNEPYWTTKEKYIKVVKRLVAAIREADPNRLIIADGFNIGRVPMHEFIELKIAQSTRGHMPNAVTHDQSPWAGDECKNATIPPTWPVEQNGQRWTKEFLYNQEVKPWIDLGAKGVGIHVGEWGAYNRTPHDVVLAWMEDYLSLWKDAGWGNALWCFRGSFGIIDSCRQDVNYENYHGHKLDRKMFELLKEHMIAS